MPESGSEGDRLDGVLHSKFLVFLMRKRLFQSALTEILRRNLPDGGFTNQLHGMFRPDATAWAMIILRAHSGHDKLVEAAGKRLERSQITDGRVVLSQDHLDTVWPTPLSILAWQGSFSCQAAWSKAVAFLLKAAGVHWENTDQSLVGHDTLIPGWPWSDATHSWVTPTAMSMLALTIAGFREHERVQDGVRLLLDRQIPSGGWNYGNTSVLGNELRPFPETTGLALNALAGQVKQKQIQSSLEFLLEHISTFRTPLSLGWSILGLKAWHLVPDLASEWINETLERGSRFDGYDTASLCVLLAAGLATGGLESLLPSVTQENH